MTTDASDTSAETRADVLAGTILDLEAERTAGDTRLEVPDDALPGVGAKQMSLQDALRIGGRATFITLAALVALDELESATLSTLAPDIRDALGISSGAMVFISSASSAFL